MADVIDGIEYRSVKIRRYMSDYEILYSSTSKTYLRKGTLTQITKELTQHKKLIQLGFPVPTLVKDKTEGEKACYIEGSLGDNHFGDLFGTDIKTVGVISDKHFKDFLEAVTLYATAQLRSRFLGKNIDEFATGFYLQDILQELPTDRVLLQTVFEKIKVHLERIPFVLTHGDFNAHNIFPKGVIDLENFHSAPLGYDLVSAIYHPYYFPVGPEYERRRSYEFSDIQREKYIERINIIFINAGVPPFSEIIDDFIFCRGIFAAAGMDATPKTQQWRYSLLRKIVNNRLKNIPINLPKISKQALK